MLINIARNPSNQEGPAPLILRDESEKLLEFSGKWWVFQEGNVYTTQVIFLWIILKQESRKIGFKIKKKI